MAAVTGERQYHFKEGLTAGVMRLPSRRIQLRTLVVASLWGDHNASLLSKNEGRLEEGEPAVSQAVNCI